MANNVANAGTAGGLLFSLLLLTTPMAPLALPSAAAIIVVRVCRKMKDDQIEREEREERKNHSRRSEAMNNLPILRNEYPYGSLAPYGSSSFFTPTVFTTSPETEIARFSPKRATKMLERQFLLTTSVDLANSSAVTEFAAQGRGSHVRITHRKGFLGLKVDEIEFSIRPF